MPPRLLRKLPIATISLFALLLAAPLWGDDASQAR